MKALNITEESLANLTTKELEALQTALNKEMAKRKNKVASVCYEHDCKDCSKYHRNKYKHWAKLVNAVNITKSNGYAFVGDFLHVDSQAVVPSDSIVVERCKDRLRCYRITGKGKELVCEGDISSKVTFISAVNEVVLEGGK